MLFSRPLRQHKQPKDTHTFLLKCERQFPKFTSYFTWRKKEMGSKAIKYWLATIQFYSILSDRRKCPPQQKCLIIYLEILTIVSDFRNSIERMKMQLKCLMLCCAVHWDFAINHDKNLNAFDTNTRRRMETVRENGEKRKQSCHFYYWLEIMNHHDGIVQIQYKRIFVLKNGLYLKSPTISWKVSR